MAVAETTTPATPGTAATTENPPRREAAHFSLPGRLVVVTLPS